MEFTTIKELCRVEKGKTPITKAIKGDYPLVVTAEKRKSHNEFQFDTKAVIIPLVSSTGHGHKSLKRIHYQEGKFSVGTILCAVIPKDENIINPKFLYHYLSLVKNRELVRRMKGMANVTLSITEIKKVPVPLLSINEQTEFIKSYNGLEEISKLLDNEIKSQLETLTQLRQAFLREAMQGKLVSNTSENGTTGAELLEEIKAEKQRLYKEKNPSTSHRKRVRKPKILNPIADDEIPFEIPENWTWCRLGEIITLVSGQDFKSSMYNEKGNGIPYLTGASNLQGGRVVINRWTETPKSFAKLGDLLLTCKGSGVGKMAFLQFKSAHIARQLMAINTIKTPLKLIYFLIIFNIRRIKSQAKSSIPGISRNTVLNILIPLPPLEIQNRIVAKLKELMAFCDELEASVKDSQETNEMLLQQVLREALEPEEVRL